MAEDARRLLGKGKPKEPGNNQGSCHSHQCWSYPSPQCAQIGARTSGRSSRSVSKSRALLLADLFQSFGREGRYGQCLGDGGWILGHTAPAELVRVPFADTSSYPVREGSSDEETLMLADILPHRPRKWESSTGGCDLATRSPWWEPVTSGFLPSSTPSSSHRDMSWRASVVLAASLF